MILKTMENMTLRISSYLHMDKQRIMIDSTWDSTLVNPWMHSKLVIPRQYQIMSQMITSLVLQPLMVMLVLQ